MKTDTEFFAAESIAALEDYDLMYVIPIPETKRDLGTKKDGKVWVKLVHRITGPVKHRVTNEEVWTSVVVLPPDGDYNAEQAFATNLSVSDEIGGKRGLRLSSTKSELGLKRRIARLSNLVG
ncbi:hypothetical protein [Halorussus sp. MSC15.2]|uniref:hypothetical protein n=1 Tax=Halorussus sp. MSC15.2 TaxID=2283638 RepID=UPI0013D8942A|nr:hypothetical protein [Halorussus sp. MSC15.2]NEU58689.1 hypothetical protein [Halorussus sp. MSC15.2]